jgi:hypothetical protein
MVDYDEHRRRMIDEVSAFIDWGLAHPDQVRWIPRRRIDEGGFTRAMQRVFWHRALSNSAAAPQHLIRRFLRWAGGG